MRWFTTKKLSTLELVRAQHRPQTARKGYHWPLLVLLAIGAIVWLLVLRQDEQAAYEQHLARVREESLALQATLAQNQLQLREAQAAQEQLLRRIEEMSAQAKRLKTELAFFKKQKRGN